MPRSTWKLRPTSPGAGPAAKAGLSIRKYLQRLGSLGTGTGDVLRAQVPGTPWNTKKKNSHVFNVYKGKERTVLNPTAIFCTYGRVEKEGKGPQNPHLNIYENNLHSSPHLLWLSPQLPELGTHYRN